MLRSKGCIIQIKQPSQAVNFFDYSVSRRAKTGTYMFILPVCLIKCPYQFLFCLSVSKNVFGRWNKEFHLFITLWPVQCGPLEVLLC